MNSALESVFVAGDEDLHPQTHTNKHNKKHPIRMITG